jgi:phage terminase large subunit-like protein
MWWQQLVADVGLEYYETDTGLLLPHYREVVVTIPRQNGKTTLVLSWELDRCLTWGRPQRVAYTAQTGGDAVKKLMKDQYPEIERSSLKPLIKKPRFAQGSEGIDFVTGSMIDVLASTESAGHGRTLDLGIIDEAFKDEDDRREGAMLPAMATRADAQLLVVSTMGTDSSHYLNRKVETGRQLVLSDRADAEIAYFEWAADENADIDDPRTWAGCMPAFGVTITERAVRHARETMTEGEFRRAYLNQRTATDERVISVDAWNRVCGDKKPDGPGVVVAIDSNPERTHSAVAAADPEGRCELVEHGEGTFWLVDYAVKLAKKWNAPIAYDPTGPAGVFGDDVAKHGVKTVPILGRDLAHACSFFYDGVVDEKLHVRTHESLNAAVASARKRVNGDAWVWSRRDADPDADLSPLVAATIACFAASRGIDPVANVH